MLLHPPYQDVESVLTKELLAVEDHGRYSPMARFAQQRAIGVQLLLIALGVGVDL